MEVAELIQTKSGLSSRFSLRSGDINRFEAVISFPYTGYCAEIYENNKLKYKVRCELRKNLNEVRKKATDKEMAIHSIFDKENRELGQLSRKRSSFWNGYFFFVLRLFGTEYIMYEIGMGKQGIKLPIYHDGKQISLAEKDTVVYDNCDTYKITSIMDDYLLPSMMLLLYYDDLRFGNQGEVVSHKRKTFYYYSTNKELKKKYDQNWKDNLLKR